MVKLVTEPSPFVTKALAERRAQQLRYSKPIKREGSPIKSGTKSPRRRPNHLVARNQGVVGGVVAQRRKVLEVRVAQENLKVLEVNQAEEEVVGGEGNGLYMCIEAK